MQNKRLSTLIKVSILAAMGFILMYLEFPLPIFPEYLKIDLSDVPPLIGGLALGPVAGLGAELIKNLLHFATATKSGGIGELANFFAGAALIVPASFIYMRHKSRKNAVIGMLAGIICMAVVMVAANYFVLLPLYGIEAKQISSMIVKAILPFNLVKAFIVSLITLVSYKRLSPILHK